MNDAIGLYLHIPFCVSKCPYCDFYSFRADNSAKDEYTDALIKSINDNYRLYGLKADTLYIGGGTPSVLGGERLSKIINTARKTFVSDGAEITVECNPYGLTQGFFFALSECGVNRISLGLQSSADAERKKLGRRGTAEDVKNAVSYARLAGIENISLDVMLGIPEQTLKSLENTLKFCVGEGIPHISCYILKIEENTPFYKMRDTLNLPDDDTVADMYLFMCEYLERHGIMQYEISNFAKQGCESRHNLKYWRCEEYLGLGAAAHSFINGKRFYYPRDEKAFVCGAKPVSDGTGGDFTEYAMLRLRLASGLVNSELKERFGFCIPEEMRMRAKIFEKNGLLISDENGIRLTRKGFLVSNTVISELIL